MKWSLHPFARGFALPALLSGRLILVAEGGPVAAVYPSLDGGGGRSGSADYSNTASFSGFGGARQALAEGGVVNRVGFAGQLNEPPSLSPVIIRSVPGRSAKLTSAAFLSGAIDPEGDGVSLVSVGPSAVPGAEIFQEDDLYVFEFTANALPTGVSYVVVDALGEASLAPVVFLTKEKPNSPGLNLVRITAGPEFVEVMFIGLPGRSYVVETSSTLLPGSWSLVVATVAGPDGIYSARVAGGDGPRFFRAFTPEP